MPHLPTGTVTFLFTDIEGSTRMLQHLGDVDAVRIFADHRRLLRAAIAASGGYELSDQGDGFLMVFPSAADAVRAAVAAQRQLAEHAWPHEVDIRVRMGMHSGNPVITDDGYVGIDVHRAARISQVAWGGQIIVSQRTRELLEGALSQEIDLRDLGEHRLKDLQRPEHIFQILGPGLAADFPPLRSLDPKRTNLPTQISTFIGREREAVRIKDLLAETRFVTLTGPGGTGKTRLAVQVAADLSDTFKDGVWLADLSGAAEVGVPRVVAGVVGARELPNEPLAVTIAEALGSRAILLVLDNCEHVVAACAELINALLQSCPNLKIMATSREVLGVFGEAVFPVPSLGLPDPDRQPAAGALADYDAVRLFIDRARAVVPAFALTEGNAAAVVQVCRRLDGIPLAIELAAARVKVLSVGEIAARLDERFRLLTGGSRTAPPRHQTLRATMDWSYALLSEPERALLRRLAAFAGGCTLDAVVSVCATDGVEAGDTLDLLARLVDKSLVMADTETVARYRLLETVREYGRERLSEAGEETATRGRHLDHYLALAEAAEPELRGHQQSDWLDILGREHDNLRSALEFSLAREAETSLRFAGALLWFWDTRGHFSEGREWLSRALAVSQDAAPRLRAHALIAAGHLSWHQSEYDHAQTLIEEGMALFTEHDDHAGIASALWFLGLVFFEKGDHAQAVACYVRGLALYRALGDRRGIIELQLWLGFALIAQGDGAGAGELFTTALTSARELQIPRAVAIALRGLGDAAFQQGDRAKARGLFEESLTTFRQIGARGFYSGLLRRLGTYAQLEADYVHAQALFAESLQCCKDLGERLGVVSCLEDLAALALASGQYERAVRLFSASSALRAALGGPTAFWAPSAHAGDVDAVRTVLGPERFATVWTEGAGMSLDQVIDYAMTNDRRSSVIAKDGAMAGKRIQGA